MIASLIDCHRKPGKVIYDWCHYLALAIVLGPMADNGSLQRKPGALRNGAPFTKMPPLSASFPVEKSLPGNGQLPSAARSHAA